MSLHVRETGPSVLVQDVGRVGWAHLGVPRAGVLDAPAAALAQRIVGNAADSAVLEVLLGGLVVTADHGVWVAVTGAPCEVTVDGRQREFGAAVWLPEDGVLRLGRPTSGLRSYLAVAGGIVVEPVLGSRSTDTLGRVGPPPVGVGDVLPVGESLGSPVPVDTPRPPTPGPLRLLPGPRADRVVGDAVALLCRTSYPVSPDSGPDRAQAAGGPCCPWRPATSCRARGWCSAPYRCRPTAARWCSSPTTRRPAATRWSRWWTYETCGSAPRLCGRARRWGFTRAARG